MHVITSPTTLRLASLDCDIPVPNVYAERGFYADIFETLLNDAVRTELKGLEVVVKVTRYDCMRGELPSEKELDDFDGIIITGSETYTTRPGLKIFGSCFGHQLLAHALFSTPNHPVVCADPAGWETGVYPITLSPSFLSHFGRVASNPTSPSHLRLQFIHADHVVLSPSQLESNGFVSIGRSEHCALQGVWKKGRVLTYQGHAEFDRFVNGETAKVFGRGLWSLETVERDDDALWAAGVMVKFFLEG